MGLGKLVWRNLGRRKLRSFLTVSSLIVALFLLCTLRSLITTIAAGTSAASNQRLIVQSAVSLFVDLPMAYQAKIASVAGVQRISPWQWFGGYYQDESNQFAQFAVDATETLAIYPEMEFIEGSLESFLGNRRGCLIGAGLVEKFGFALGDTLPILPGLHPHPDGPGVAWEFVVEGIYEPTQRNFDRSMLMFHWKYFEETTRAASGEEPGVGTYVLQLSDEVAPTTVMARVDELFENGPQRVQTTSEAEFQAQFISMLGNIPFFLTTIGGGVLAAILLAVVNTMMMAGREQTRDLGILKALGFSDGDTVRLLVFQSLFLCGLGGALGIGLAKLAEPGLARAMGSFFPGYHVAGVTLLQGLSVTIALGLVAGIAPAWRAARLGTVDALATEE